MMKWVFFNYYLFLLLGLFLLSSLLFSVCSSLVTIGSFSNWLSLQETQLKISWHYYKNRRFLIYHRSQLSSFLKIKLKNSEGLIISKFYDFLLQGISKLIPTQIWLTYSEVLSTYNFSRVVYLPFVSLFKTFMMSFFMLFFLLLLIIILLLLDYG